MIRYENVKLADVLDRLKWLFKEHYKEVAHYQDIPLDPNYDAYLQAETCGLLQTFVAYEQDEATEKIIGYAIYSVNHNTHYQSSLQAHQDILFIHPECRGFGRDFIHFCDEQLKKDGVQVVYHHVKEKFNFGPMLEKEGYELIEHIYGKRLDK